MRDEEEELPLPDGVADFIMEYQDTDKDLLMPVSDLRKWLNILLGNVHEIADYEALNFLDVLDPMETGMFDFTTLLTLTGELCSKQETAASPEKVQQQETNNNTIYDAKESESKRYTLRPRNAIKKPRRMIQQI